MSRFIGGRNKVGTACAVCLCIVTCLLCVGVGIVLGYVIFSQTTPGEPKRDECSISTTLKRIKECEDSVKAAEKCEVKLARSYVAYHLGAGEPITIDGFVGDEAWTEVDSVEPFVDLRGTEFQKPDLSTEVRIRWDDTNLYVGAYLSADHIWAVKTQNEMKVWKDNAFEVYVDADGSTHNYKEIQMNALGTTWDLMLTKAYIDGGEAVSSWDSRMTTAVHVQGTINNSADKDTYWSLEMAIPFSTLMYNTSRTVARPADGEIWRIVLSRLEWNYRINNVSGGYIDWNRTKSEASWWSWNHHGARELHLPDRWGYVQFSMAKPNSTKFVASQRIKHEKALFDVFNAMKAYHATTGVYTPLPDQLNLPLYLRLDTCYKRPNIVVDPTLTETFVVSLTTVGDTNSTGHIRQDRYLWFDGEGSG